MVTQVDSIMGPKHFLKSHLNYYRPRGGYDYFLLLLCKSSIWFSERHFYKMIK
jgi:hypothetical protein